MAEEKKASLGKALAGSGFVSHYLHSLDPKKRLTMPSEWRELVGMSHGLYVLPGLGDDKCLYVFLAAAMAERLEKLRKIGIGDKKARGYLRVLASKSDFINAWDSQGRIRIKDELLEYAELKDLVEMVGAWDHFELWNPKGWKAASKVDRGTMEDAFKQIEL